MNDGGEDDALALVVSVHRLHADIRNFLLEHGELSYASAIEEVTPKVLLLAAASLFEDLLTRAILDFVDGEASPLVREFVRRKALERQFHALFDWDRGNANRFWAFFGPDFANYAKELVAADQELDASVRAFIEVGSLRNQMVHGNYVTFELLKTADEVLASAALAHSFISRLPSILNGFDNRHFAAGD